MISGGSCSGRTAAAKRLFAVQSPYFVPANLREESALNAAACKAESVDLVITSPPYNVGIAYKNAV